MRMLLSRLSKILWAVVFCCALFFPREVWPQVGFERAHDLMRQWGAAQQAEEQNPSESGLRKLREITSSIAQEVPELLKKGTVEFLNSSAVASPSEIQEKISATFWDAPPGRGKYDPEVFVFPTGSGQGGCYLVAYNVPYCASCSRAWIGLIGKKGGRYEVLSEEGNSFNGKGVHVVPLARSEDGKDRFLIYGTNWGDAHSRLSMVAYSVDHAKLVKFWARTDLVQGRVEVTSKHISLTFLTALTPPWNERTEVYEVQRSEDIRLQKSSERANP
jgi:hypothetical protein